MKVAPEVVYYEVQGFCDDCQFETPAMLGVEARERAEIEAEEHVAIGHRVAIRQRTETEYRMLPE